MPGQSPNLHRQSRMPRRHLRSRGSRGGGTDESISKAPDRFRRLDRYRVEREWKRFEGTPQRDLFRELRQRFLDRHRTPGHWTLEVGPGPGRFSPAIGTVTSIRLLADLSTEMLRFARGHLRVGFPNERFEFLRADGRSPPFREHRVSEVVALGNSLGFAGQSSSSQLLERLAECAAPEGLLILEIAPGSGERSRYLHRLPPTAVGRLFEAPVSAIQARIEREGFDHAPPAQAKRHGFQRFRVEELTSWLSTRRWNVLEVLAVAPALGLEPARVQSVQRLPKAWSHLLEIEEELGREAARQGYAAAVLLAARAPPESE